MQGTILLNSNENTRKIEEEEKTRFVRSVLESLGLPIEGLWDENGELSLDNKMKLRELLAAFSIEIIDDFDGELRIYVERELVGEWKKCEYILKKDLTQIDPAKKFYLEMKVNYWSVFENTE